MPYASQTMENYLQQEALIKWSGFGIYRKAKCLVLDMGIVIQSHVLHLAMMTSKLFQQDWMEAFYYGISFNDYIISNLHISNSILLQKIN